MTIIAIYEPNENDTEENKNKLWKDLKEITENSRGKIYMAGDFHRRVDIGDITSKDATEKG